ncbi:MAG TPA: phage virion morphogenesis protein [Candidatus Desulfovibrio intestinavium]|uniref:Phage virion morphogenesis protein n=1 Tax=Candidatus Desulfovibrio intestinavium TaxID=2838534 RepID=A0A9D2KRD6_9BACT|nr:phage virion morphogenesis protein [Candidatus Desulfovibrio intestinavium]
MAKNGVSLHWGGLGKAVSKAGHKLGNTQALMDSIGEALVSGTLKRFDDEEDPTGKKWKPSARATAEGGQTLTDTATLRRSIEYATTSDKVMVGSNLRYARIHQKGGKTGKGHKVDMPARPYLGVSAEDMDEVRAVMTDFLKGAFKA